MHWLMKSLGNEQVYVYLICNGERTHIIGVELVVRNPTTLTTQLPMPLPFSQYFWPCDLDWFS
jgi:hypothetical protein